MSYRDWCVSEVNAGRGNKIKGIAMSGGGSEKVQIAKSVCKEYGIALTKSKKNKVKNYAVIDEDGNYIYDEACLINIRDNVGGPAASQAAATELEARSQMTVAERMEKADA